MEEDREGSRLVFYRCIRKTMLMCRFSGLLPVSGMILKTSRGLRFSWISPYMILIFAPCTLGSLLRVGFMFHDDLKHDWTLRRASNTVFAVSTCASTFQLVTLSYKWRSLVHSTEDAEELLPPLKEVEKVVRVCDACAAIVMLLGAVERIMFVLNTYHSTLLCFALSDDSGLYLRSFYLTIDSWLYDYVPFNYVIGFINQLLVTQATFVGNFTDVLVACFSIYLIAQFNNFNQTVIKEAVKAMRIPHPTPRCFPWNELQIHYTRLTRLVTLIDQHINPLVFISFSSNLFFICQQLFYLINENFRKDLAEGRNCHFEADWETTIYLIYSFLFLGMRILLVSLLAAQVHKISRDSLFTVHSLPTAFYNPEMQRFIDQVFHCRVGLSGLNFFFVTRGMILTVAATVVTYELVLLQIQPKKSLIS